MHLFHGCTYKSFVACFCRSAELKTLILQVSYKDLLFTSTEQGL